jgi:hypothetical protein
MKKTIIPLLLLLFTSCAVTDFYQVYTTDFDKGTLSKNKIVFEDKNCIVTYDLWADGGNIGFNIFNKTENDLTINLTKTYFVINGIANEYFQNRTFTRSSNVGTAITSYYYPYFWNYNIWNVQGTGSTGFSTSYIEKPELTIPSKTSINILEYHITNARYYNCDLSNYHKNDNATINFDKTNSPFVFYNLITYTIKHDTSRIENKFYVNEITNYPVRYMTIKIDTNMCGEKLNIPIKVLKKLTPDKFYIKYTIKK